MPSVIFVMPSFNWSLSKWDFFPSGFQLFPQRQRLLTWILPVKYILPKLSDACLGTINWTELKLKNWNWNWIETNIQRKEQRTKFQQQIKVDKMNKSYKYERQTHSACLSFSRIFPSSSASKSISRQSLSCWERRRMTAVLGKKNIQVINSAKDEWGGMVAEWCMAVELW